MYDAIVKEKRTSIQNNPPDDLDEPTAEENWKLDFSNVPCESLMREKVLREAWESIKQKYLDGKKERIDKFYLTFSKPVTLRINLYKTVETQKAKVGLFISDRGIFCYTFGKRTGFYFDSSQIESLISIEAVLPEETRAEKLKLVKSFANRIHPNAWANLREEINADPGKALDRYGAMVTSIKSKFPDNVIDQLKEAFEKKEQYSYRQDPWGKKGRHLSVETKLCDDGIFKAWFSSEYPGCANGDYWLLINPTTAIFMETD
jgi:hypothetical protein